MDMASNVAVFDSLKKALVCIFSFLFKVASAS